MWSPDPSAAPPLPMPPSGGGGGGGDTGRRCWAIIGVIVAVSAVLCLARLGEPSMWDDESYVALTARNLLRFGRFAVWDGRNLYIGMDSGFNLRVRTPSLDTAVTAASFRILGESNTAARLPFALFAIATLGAFLWMMRRRFPDQPALVAYAVALLGLSTQFLLQARCCRYYAAAVLFGVLSYLAYRWTLRARSVAAAVALALAALLMFYAHPPSAAAMLLALAAIHVVFYARQLGWRGHWPMAVAAVLFLAGALPLTRALQLMDFKYPQAAGAALPRRLRLVAQNLRDLNVMTALPWMLVVGLVAFLWAARRDGRSAPLRRAGAEWLLLVLAYAVAIGLVSPQVPSEEGIADVRYLFPALPFAAAAVACLLAWVHRWSCRAAMGVAGIAIFCTAFAWTPFDHAAPFTSHVRWLLPGLVSEVASPYPTATASVCQVLRENAKQDDVVAAFPTYFAYPLIYYVGDRVRVGALLSRGANVPAKLLEPIHAPLFMDDTFPDWVICYGASPDPLKVVQYFSRSGRRYELATALPLYPGQTQRPELPWHSFGPREADPEKGVGVYVFRAVSR